MQRTIRVCKALTEPIRLRLLALLGGGELCVCDLVAVLQLPQSTVSRHLAVLKATGWVTERRQGVWMYYRLADAAPAWQETLRQSFLRHLDGIREVQEDRENLGRHLRHKKQTGCR